MKNLLSSITKIVTITAGICLSAPALAIDPEVLTLISEGDTYLEAGDAYSANISYVNAKGLAADKRDWDGMLSLSDRFLKTASEYHGKDCFLIASQIGHEIIDRAKIANDQQMCDDGINVLDSMSLSWESGLIDIPMGDDTKSQMQAMSDTAWTNANYYRDNGCF